MSLDRVQDPSVIRPRGPRRGPTASWVRAIAWFVLVVGISGSLVGAFVWKHAADRETSSSVENRANAAEALVSTRLALDGNLMTQIRGMVISSPEMTNAQFYTWWKTSEVSKRFPGGVGIDYTQRVSADELPAFIAARAVDPVTNPDPGPFTLYPATAAPEYCLQRLGVTDQTQVNGQVVPAGLNFCAAELQPGVVSTLPKTLGTATDLGVTTLVTPGEMGAGMFAMFLPVYSGGTTPTTVYARRAASLGWVTGSFDAAALTASVGGGSPAMAVQVSHTTPDGITSVISTDGDPSALHDPHVTTSRVDDGSWTVSVFDATTSGGPTADQQAVALLLTGLTLSLLAFLFVRVLGGSRERALDLVAERTGQLAYQALHDSLTGLPNRALILDRATGALNRARRDDIPIAAFFIDLDDFKSINDTLGHGAGDDLLQSVATRFRTALRASDTVGRLGGDEFVILAEGASLAGGPEVVAQRILDVLHEPFVLRGESRHVGASVGIASGPRATADEWLRDADVALYEAKAAGKGRYVVFVSDMEDAARQRVAVEQDLRTVAGPIAPEAIEDVPEQSPADALSATGARGI